MTQKAKYYLLVKSFIHLIKEIIDEIPTIKKIISMDEGSDWEDYISWRDRFDDNDPILNQI